MNEQGIRTAFQNVKKDILEMKDQLLTIAERQEKLEASFEESQKQELVQIRTTKKATNKPAKQSEKKTSKKKR